MWGELLTAVYVSALVGGLVYVWAYQRGFDEALEVYEQWEAERGQRELERSGGVVDPRGRVPLLGWVAVVPGAAREAAEGVDHDGGVAGVEGGDAASRTVSEAQVAELEEWFRTKEQHGE